MAGYSTNPLAKKLGIKECSRVKVVNAPAHCVVLLDPLPPGVHISNRLKSNRGSKYLLNSRKRTMS